jgi:hypothetical protein
MQQLSLTLLSAHQKKTVVQILSLKKDFNFQLFTKLVILSYVVMLQNGIKNNFGLDNIKELTFSYVTMLAVQNDLHHSVCTVLFISKNNL